jgi:hypothetical protein
MRGQLQVQIFACLTFKILELLIIRLDAVKKNILSLILPLSHIYGTNIYKLSRYFVLKITDFNPVGYKRFWSLV